MAGNTRLRGFGVDNTVQLTRWGGEIALKLPHEAIKELRRACFEVLPKHPPERMGGVHPDDFAASYDESVGRVQASMTPAVAKQLAELLRHGGIDVKEENAKLAENCAFELEYAHQQHLDYLDKNEPGVEG